jgi:hypothetical protein
MEECAVTKTEPVTELDTRYSDPNALATGWDGALPAWETAELYWLSTVRPDGRPHVTPLIAVWLDGATYFCTGPAERKAKNLDGNPHVVLTTGTNSLNDGLDLVVEGDATRVVDNTLLRRVADAYVEKYGSTWQFEVGDGVFLGPGGDSGAADVYQVRPSTAFGFAKGGYSQTRWRFADH